MQSITETCRYTEPLSIRSGRLSGPCLLGADHRVKLSAKSRFGVCVPLFESVGNIYIAI